MSGLVVRFDEELSVAHKIADGQLPCPRGVLTVADPPWRYQDSRNGRVVLPCALTYGHDGPCVPLVGRHRIATVCGLSFAALPFVPSPEGTPPCPECFAGDDAAWSEPELFGTA